MPSPAQPPPARVKPVSPKRGSGRPPKFAEARRAVTVTLPERTLKQLAAIDADRARAIVTAASRTTRRPGAEAPPVEVVEALPGQAVILVRTSRYLPRIEWLRLVAVDPDRNLLAIPSGTAVESLEVAVEDLLDALPPDEPRERELLTALHKILRQRRRQRTVSKMEILLMTAPRPAS
jgi:hypothetical protein